MSDGAGVEAAARPGDESGCGASEPFRTRPVGFGGSTGTGVGADTGGPDVVAPAARDATDRSRPDDAIEGAAASDTGAAGRSTVFVGAAAGRALATSIVRTCRRTLPIAIALSAAAANTAAAIIFGVTRGRRASPAAAGRRRAAAGAGLDGCTS